MVMEFLNCSSSNSMFKAEPRAFKVIENCYFTTNADIYWSECSMQLVSLEEMQTSLPLICVIALI